AGSDERIAVVDGWRDAGADPAVFAGSVVTAAVAWQGAVVAVGCDHEATGAGPLEPTDAPVWVGSGADWRRAGPVTVPSPTGTGGTPVTCLDQVVASPFGLFAAAGAVVLQSADGLDWEPVNGLWPLGEGWASALFALGDRVTVLSSRASLAESTVAALWTTTDGATWTVLGDPERYEAGVGDDPAVGFDNADVAEVVERGGTLVAVGASPGGAFVPTAAAWTSTDTVTWTPAAVAGGEDCYLTAVTVTDPGLFGAGWCADTGQPATWTSADGTVWQPAVAPVAELPEFSFLEVLATTWLGAGTVAITGSVSHAGQEAGPDGQVQWLIDDGVLTRDDLVAVPYHRVGGTGFWPAVGAVPPAVLLAD
ncbi:MAG TPA: hypothetical protein PKB06_13165, partial [Actinotalea sp.]|nr:hypothetical protein [Actinotalea sp.]